MVKFCPNCGFKLEKKYKFCPECGFNIESVDEINSDLKNSYAKTAQNSQEALTPVICENCGEENNPENTQCSSCGIKLRNSTAASSNKTSAGKKSSEKSYSNKSLPPVKSVDKKQATGKINNNSKEIKKLNNIKTITVVSVAFGIAIIILIFSGALNSLVLPSGESAANKSQNTSSGVDLGNLDKINSLEAQIKSNPQDTAAILELAHLKNDSGLYEQAIKNYKQYLALVPKDPDARIDMGICYYNLQNYQTAIDEMEQAIKYDPKHQIGYLDLGIVNLAAGNLEKSKEMLKKAVQLDPNSEYGKKAEELLKSHSSNENKNGGQ